MGRLTEGEIDAGRQQQSRNIRVLDGDVCVQYIDQQEGLFRH